MAKSSLQFSEKRNVDVYDSDSYAIRTLEKHDCGKVIVLSNARGHTLTLPSAAVVGEGWNVRFVVGAVHNDRSVRDSSSIVAASATEVISLVAKKTGGSLGAGAVGTLDKALDAVGIAALDDGVNEGNKVAKQTALTTEDFTIGPIPVAAAGSGTAFSFKFVIEDADLPGTNTAGQFVLSLETLNTDAKIATAIVKLIKGEEQAGTERPSSGEGSLGNAIAGITAAVDAGVDTAVDLTSTAKGAAANVDPVAAVPDNDNAAVKILKDGAATVALASGANRTGISLDTTGTHTLLITEGATIGDQIEMVVVNGQFQARSLRAE